MGSSQPTYLNDQPDLYVGLFVANSGNENVKVLTVDSYSVSVSVDVAAVPEPSTFVAGVVGVTLIGMARLLDARRLSLCRF